MREIYNHHFPTPDFLTMPACALDISDESIKYGELTPSKDGFKLKYYGNEKIPPGIVVAGKIENEAKLVEILNSIKNKVKMKYVRASLPEEQMYLFNLVLPNVPNNQMKETILLQLEDHIPLPANDVVFEYELIREINKDTVLVQVAAVAASLIESYLSIFSQAGLVPMSFELEAQAIARSVVPEDLKGAVMVVDFGRTRIGISIVENGRVLFTSTFSMGGQKITEVIAKHFKISVEQAEQMKKSYSNLGSDAENDIFPAIISNLSILLDELRKHFSYWQTHLSEDGQPHAKIEKIILCGGEANLYGVVPYLKTSMNLPADYANVWVNMTDITKDLPTMAFDESLGYATVFGLALGGFIKE
ncbi:MAG: Type pilus assembly protein PilM [Patescibacteria group bacterium]|jgi:type IV pilus assembly protein PilM|nr:Type pilus assembly protein PilM [Patescibacteria group bacterium]